MAMELQYVTAMQNADALFCKNLLWKKITIICASSRITARNFKNIKVRLQHAITIFG